MHLACRYIEESSVRLVTWLNKGQVMAEIYEDLSMTGRSSVKSYPEMVSCVRLITFRLSCIKRDFRSQTSIHVKKKNTEELLYSDL